MNDPRAISGTTQRLGLSWSRPARAPVDPISCPGPVVASLCRPARVHHYMHRAAIITDAHVNPANGVEQTSMCDKHTLDFILNRPAQVHHHHHYESAIAIDARVNTMNGIKHPLSMLEPGKHTLFFILDSSTNSSSLGRENTNARHDDSVHHNRSPVVKEELSCRIAVPPAAPRAWTPSDSSCQSGDSSPSMAVAAMIHDLRMSSPTPCRPAPGLLSSSVYAETAAWSPPSPPPPSAVPSVSLVMQETRKSSPGMARRASTAAPRSASKTELLSKLEKKRRRMCKMDGCENYIVHKGLCCRHGGGKKCTIAGCNTSAKHLGLCWKHGGSIECIIDGCTKRAKARRVCWAHGGGTKCASAECEKVAVSGGFCWAHGGGKRCNFVNCNKPAYERTQNFCAKHHAEMQRVTYFEV